MSRVRLNVDDTLPWDSADSIGGHDEFDRPLNFVDDFRICRAARNDQAGRHLVCPFRSIQPSPRYWPRRYGIGGRIGVLAGPDINVRQHIAIARPSLDSTVGDPRANRADVDSNGASDS